MRISNSKKQLAKIIHENGGWRDGEFAAQDKTPARIDFYHEKPWINGGQSNWSGGYIMKHKMYAAEVIPNWHQTILSRDEYFHMYPAPDADGWIEWKGGECPVEGDAIIDIRFRDGHEERGVDAAWDWEHSGGGDIIAYRLHKPEQAKSEFCESVERSIPEPSDKPTIEQLAAEYRSAKDYADRKQEEADAAKADAGARLKALELAGEAIGIIVSPITVKQEPELVITDWRDLKVGDEVDANYRGVERVVGAVMKIDGGDSNQPILVSDGKRSVWATEFKFIRRP